MPAFALEEVPVPASPRRDWSRPADSEPGAGSVERGRWRAPMAWLRAPVVWQEAAVQREAVASVLASPKGRRVHREHSWAAPPPVGTEVRSSSVALECLLPVGPWDWATGRPPAVAVRSAGGDHSGAKLATGRRLLRQQQRDSPGRRHRRAQGGAAQMRWGEGDSSGARRVVPPSAFVSAAPRSLRCRHPENSCRPPQCGRAEYQAARPGPVAEARLAPC